ncbi:dihydropteroate synthase [Chitinasiproducens palmae]|uniref:Dihydropteroate synthase n=1 Tax=Chitinasiproducens palmae TaxID=1770053 RepID=A0A1H2PUZ4_9BURK|nr:dihydropteroate synthase [Chitinasiproducens palmae]SDV51027.1 Dihydropteroate synthase [Chitinasiproducens palmae]
MPLTSGELDCGAYRLPLTRPLVMGILNVTPDSFSDGGRFIGHDEALRRAESMIKEGADLIDVGGESTRPGAPPVSLDEELGRVIPIVERLAGLGVPISVDTYKPEVMREALTAGASMINDIRAFTEDGALEAIAGSRCAVCVMHMQGDPQTMQKAPVYQNVVSEVRTFLSRRVTALEASGVARERIVVDPGFGFGKTVEHNFELLRELTLTSPGGLPVLVGLSRKSMLTAIVGERPLDARMPASVAAAVMAAARGAALVRVHDVGATVDALKIWQAVDDHLGQSPNQ